jgi:hypothetical protein
MSSRRALLAALLACVACDRGGAGPTPPPGPPPDPVCTPPDPACTEPDPPPDPPPGPACRAAVAELTAYPGRFAGTVLGGGADLRAPEGACAMQAGDVWYDLVGEDVVLRLGGLTPGQRYGVRLAAEDDLGFYVLAACPEVAGDVTGCLAFTDRAIGDESGTFVAMAEAHFLVIDVFEPPTTGAFEVTVVP